MGGAGVTETSETVMRAIEAITADTRKTLISAAPYLSRQTESPIEVAMLMALSHALKAHGDHITFKAQEVIGRFRVDFLLECDGVRLVVECDGHDFHERTKKQAARDRSRDRWLLSQGIPVMRFTGSEIYADVLTCAREAIEHIDKIACDAFWAKQKELA